MNANCCTAWRNVATVAKRELYGYFLSPVAYVFVVIFLALTGFFTFMAGGFFERGEASLNWPFFSWHPWLYLFLVPAVGMRLWAEEHRLGTMELLLTMPITPWQAILGKFLASWAVLALALVLTFPIVLSVAFLGDPDSGAILCGYVGSLLLAGGYLSVTCMTSAMTRNQVISFIVAVVALLFLILAGFPVVTDMIQKLLRGGSGLVDFIAAFSVMTHFYAFQKGVLDLRDVLFFLSLIGFSLFTTSVILRAQRSG